MKKVINLNQDVFNFFPSLTEWPEGYKEGLTYLIKGRKGDEHWTYLDLTQKHIFGFDIETEGLNPYDKRYKIISFAISPEQKIGYGSFLLLDEGTEGDLQILSNILGNENNILVGHNIKYDCNWISVKYGIQIKAMLFDTMFAQYLLDENIESNSLGELSKMFLDLGKYKDDVNRNDLKRMAKDDVLIYNCKDADASRRLYDYFVPKLKAGGYDKLMSTASMVLPILSKMETRGIYLDKEYANKTKVKLFKELVSLRYDMVEMAQVSFNPDSPQSLGSVLYNKMGFTPTKFTPTGNPSTDSEAIGYLVSQDISKQQSEFIDSILKYKKKLKLITTYYEPIERWTRYDGRVHTNYSLGRQRNEESSGGTVTGRLSSSNPNLQNIPRGKEHRGMFAATKGYSLLDGDFSQLELRVAAFLSQETVMLDAFHNGLDIHTAVMSELTGIPYDEIQQAKEVDERVKNDRVAFKEVNFGIFYQMTAKRLQRTLRLKAGIIKTVDECQKYINDWFGKFKVAKQWIDSVKIDAVNNQQVRMPLGQLRRLPGISFDRTREAAHMIAQAVNFPVQSFASWICLIGLILTDQYFENNMEVEGHPVLCVHDSITTEIKLISHLGNNHPDNQYALECIKQDIKKIMEVETVNYLREVFGVHFNVPLVFDISLKERWS